MNSDLLVRVRTQALAQPNTVFRITWKDSCSMSTGWQNDDEIYGWSTDIPDVISVGTILRIDENLVVLASSYQSLPISEVFNMVIAIPTMNIISAERMVPHYTLGEAE